MTIYKTKIKKISKVIVSVNSIIITNSQTNYICTQYVYFINAYSLIHYCIYVFVKENIPKLKPHHFIS